MLSKFEVDPRKISAKKGDFQEFLFQQLVYVIK